MLLKNVRKSDIDKNILTQEIQIGKLISRNDLENNMLGNLHEREIEYIYLYNYEEEDNRMKTLEENHLNKTIIINDLSETMLNDESSYNTQYNQSVKLLEMKNVLRGINTENKMNLENMIKEKNNEVLEVKINMSNAMNNYFSRFQITSSKKKNCIFFQEMMKSMPSQEKKWSKKVSDFFSSRSVTNLKSYRTLAVEMLLSFEANDNKREFLNLQVEKYRTAKALYHQEFMNNYDADYETEKENINQMREEVILQLDQLDEMFLIQQELENTFATMRIELKNLANILEGGKFAKLQKEKLSYKQMAEEVAEATEDIDYSKFEQFFSNSSTVKQFIKEFIEVTDQSKKWKQMQMALDEHFLVKQSKEYGSLYSICLLYTSPSPRD